METDVLIVAPATPDLRAVVRGLGGEFSGKIGNLNVSTAPVGVGLVSAAAGASKRIFSRQPRAIVMIGTCGLFLDVPGARPMELVVPTDVILCERLVLQQRAEFPGVMTTRISTHAPLAAGLANTHSEARRAAIGSAIAELRCEEISSSGSQHFQCVGINTEVFGIAQAAHLAGIPFASALVATHLLGPTAGPDRSRFRSEALNSLGELVLGWLHAGAPGLPHS